ncbi:MAG: CocE/NonD family hydrolase [Myxococcales bacterium]|nr:CocE/NonD family hydrolase [Myxococcales bacterium]
MTVSISEFPHKIREIENAWIPLADGKRLAARIWLPEDAAAHPVPAIFEYVPYRKRDHYTVNDESMHPYFAGHGYASLRVDIRGSGDSDGVLRDEYLKQEHDDALDVIAWLARQPWCTGSVGMKGYSWGGFNSLQVAARRPAALKAIMSVYSTTDRYHNDIHFTGGCLLNSKMGWAFQMFCYNARPPDPALVGERWRQMWMERLEAGSPWILPWLKRQRRDAFYKHGSVIEDFSQIVCPVYAVGGWADSYSDAVPELLEGLTVPRKGLMGPWGHVYPNRGYPGPQIGYLQECLRWWDHWLKGAKNGIMDEPMYRAWMQESVRPAPFHENRPGRWIAEPSWPSPNVRMRKLFLNAGGLGESAAPTRPLSVLSPMTTGLSARRGHPGGRVPAEPLDQRADDGQSLCFDTEPLTERLEILGSCRVTLEVAADKPNAFVCVRLCDVAGDGASSRISYGLLNLSHRTSHEFPEPLAPGRRYTVTVPLKHAGHAFPAGHRIRVAVSTSQWPMVWPSPEAATVTVTAGASAIEIPVRAPRAEDDRLAPFARPEASALSPRATLVPGRQSNRVERDVATGTVTITNENDLGTVRHDPHGLIYAIATRANQSIRDDDPNSATVEHWGNARFERGDWSVRTETHARMTSDRDSFTINADLTAYEGDKAVFARSWVETIPRDLV